MMSALAVPVLPPLMMYGFPSSNPVLVEATYDMSMILALLSNYGPLNMAGVSYRISSSSMPAKVESIPPKIDETPLSPGWIEFASATSLGLAAVGLIAGLTHGGFIAGLFPIGMGGAWLTSRFAREY